MSGRIRDKLPFPLSCSWQIISGNYRLVHLLQQHLNPGRARGQLRADRWLCGYAGEHGGLKLTANARAALMQRLSGAPGPANGMPAMGMSWSCLICTDACCLLAWGCGDNILSQSTQTRVRPGSLQHDPGLMKRCLGQSCVTLTAMATYRNVPKLTEALLRAQKICQALL